MGKALTEWPVGAAFRLVRVLEQSSEFLRFLTESGLNLSAVGQVVEHAPFAATTTVEVEGRTTVLSEQVAEKLIVITP